VSSARDEILARVRAAKGNTASTTVGPGHGPAAAGPERAYRRSDPRPHRELVALFCERVDDYRAEVQRVAPDHVTEAIAAAAARHGAHRLVVPPQLRETYRPTQLKLIADSVLAAYELDRLDGVITGCTVAIAETGTIALSAAADEGPRQLSLVPDLHICVVGESQIVATVPEAITRLGQVVRAERRPLTLISGPSATSDIELQRVEGVHGPRKLVVLVVSGTDAGTNEESP
jgi:L-lactate dehydrogenase complex protein LldG